MTWIPPGGFGRAIRSGLEAVRGDVVVDMADLSDSPEDVVDYYRKIGEGYDCVFGSRFIVILISNRLDYPLDSGIRPESNGRSGGPGEVADGTVSAHLGNPGSGRRPRHGWSRRSRCSMTEDQSPAR